MIVAELAVENFLGYRKRSHIDLRGKHTVGVVGRNEAGKSSLLHAVSYAIYGRTKAERDAQLINDHASSSMLVELVLDINGREHHIARGRTAKGEAIVRVDDVKKPSEASAYALELVRLCYEDFIGLSYFVQGDIHQLMAGNKGEYFRRWTSGLAFWEGLEEAAKGWLTEERASLHTLTSTRDQALARAEKLEDYRISLESAERSASAAHDRAELAAEAVATLKVEIAKRKAEEEAHRAADLSRGELKRLTAEIATLGRQISGTRSEFRDVRAGTCPFLQVECARLKRSGDDRRKELNERLGAMNRQKREAEARKVEVEAALEKVSRKLVKGTLGRLRAELAEAKRALNTANRSLHSAQEIRAAAKMRLENAEEAEGFVAKLAGEIERKERKVSALQFLSYMCGKRGLPAQIIEGELQRIEGRCNWVLERLDYQKRVKFLPYKELSGYERVCPACGGEVWYKNTCKGCGEPRPHKRKDDPTIVVLDGEIERAFALESGGAQVLQSFAVRLAGGMFVSSMTGVPMRMVMLDEVFAHLDASNRQKLMALVISKLSSVFGLEQQLVVSHHDDVVNAVDDMLVVTRERGSSVVHWA